MLRLLLFVSLAVLISSDAYNEIYSHLQHMESFCVRGYIPTAGSGVTIATGVDLGQWTASKLQSMGVPSDVLAKLKKYIGYKTRSAVHNAGLNEKDLVLTKDEASRLDKPFTEEGIKALKPYFGRLSAKGQAVLVSLRHWNGRLKNSKDDGKLSRTVNGKVVSYVWDAVKDKTATDNALLTALKNTRATHKSGSTGYNRLGNEIAYLDGSVPTPPPYCLFCKQGKKEYCF